MFRLKIMFLTFVVTAGHWALLPDSTEAGPLRDWLARRRARICSRPVAAPATPVTTNFAGLQPGQCATTCQKTCSRTVVNYVPCTSYRTTTERVPVTQYRPQTSSDPCTGCSVTCMRPCTTYTYRTRRVPYTTYRPVYRQETYKVPVTTITNNCAGASTCDTCATGGLPAAGSTTTNFPAAGGAINAPAPGVFPGGSNTVNSIPSVGTLSTEGGFNIQGPFQPGQTISELPANTTPSLNPQNSNRSVIEALQGGGSSTRTPISQPDPSNWSLTSSRAKRPNWNDVPVRSTPVVAVADTSPVTRQFAYTAIKRVSYEVEEQETAAPVATTIRGKFSAVKPRPKAAATQERAVNAGWESVEW